MSDRRRALNRKRCMLPRGLDEGIFTGVGDGEFWVPQEHRADARFGGARKGFCIAQNGRLSLSLSARMGWA